MVEPMVIDVDEAAAKGKMNCSDKRKTLKRKRGGVGALPDLMPEEKSAKIKYLREELKSLFNFYRELNGKKEYQNVEDNYLNNNNVDSAIAVLMEESGLPLSKLVSEIFEKLKGKFGNGNGGVAGGLSSLASVKSRVLLIGQRVFYGISDADADILEDDSEAALCCWETRDMKLVPKSMRAVLKSRRTYRKKIQERLIAVSAMIAALEKSESHQNYQEVMKASERLGKILNEADIRLLVDIVLQKSGAEGAIKEAKQQEKLLIKQLEKNKREEEKEKRRMERELQKEKLQNEKELKRLQDEAEKEEKHREKEETEMNKLTKRNQDGAEKDQRLKEKEEAKTKKHLALQKQASLMEHFLKRGKTNSATKNDQPQSNATVSSPKRDKEKPESVTLAIDSVLSMNSEIKAEDIRKMHLNSWHRLSNAIRLNRLMHWGIRWKPKIDLVKELKLTANRGLTREDEMNIENLVDGWVGSSTDSRLSPRITDSTISNSRTHVRSKQLLQFDKSHRPAFYGVRLKKSQFVSARHPFVKDRELDYEIDSDEEWEEEEPGESLSDCEKDGEEENLDEGCSRGDDDDESEDGFFVPDGYLSEDEGVEFDKTDVNYSGEETRSSPSSKEALLSEAVNQLFRQQKYLHNLTEHALHKNQPLIVLNFMHQKAPLLSADNVTGAEKLQQMCLQALSICAFPDGPSIQISSSDDTEEEQGACTSNTKTSSTTSSSAPTILDSDLAQIVSVIQSCSHGINKLVESLHEKFPSISKSQLRNKVREISDFVDNRWQVKKDILVKLGLTISPEKGSGRTKSIAIFFSKRCLPPGKSINPNETSPQTSQKPVASTQQQEGTAQEH